VLNINFNAYRNEVTQSKSRNIAAKVASSYVYVHIYLSRSGCVLSVWVLRRVFGPERDKVTGMEKAA